MNGEESPKRPQHLECIIEGYTDGERRALTRATLREIAPAIFTVSPFFLREISGPDIDWNLPPRGAAISTPTPITSFSEARDVLLWWTCRTVATCARLHR